MTVRSPLSEVLTTDITQPSPATVFIVSDSGVEGNLTVANAITLLATKGDKGDAGRPGYTGSTGTVGYTGSTGTQGNIGFTGSIGRDGYTGSRGYNGSTGFTGSKGYTGSTGTLGRTGFTGSRGYIGSTGTQGDIGFTGSAGSEFSTATNMAGGAAGTMLIQRDTSSTAFISTGTVGDLLQYQANNTATWVSTSTITVNKAINSDKLSITALTSSEITPTKYITMVSGVSGYYAEGAISDLSYHTNNKILTSPGITVSAITSATSTLTGALIVAGGIGVAGDLFIGGTITANKLVIQYTTVTNVSVITDDVTKINNTTSATSTTTGALVVQGGVGIGGNLVVGGIIYGTIAGGINLATNLAGGSVGQIPYQFAANTTAFTNAGSSGQLLMSSGASVIGPAFRSTSTIQVGYAANLLGGGVGYLPYQSAFNTTAFLAPGANGTVLSSNGTVLSWQPVSGTGSGSATTATNLAGGTAGQLPYQTAPGRTSFVNVGTAGQLLMSNGANVPVYVSTSSITVGHAVSLSGGSVGSLPYQSAVNTTAMLDLGTAGQLLTVNSLGTALTWTSVSGLSAGIATTATNIAGGDINKVPYQTAPGLTSFYGPGTAGQLLVSNGTNAGGPSYVSTSSISVGYAKNILGGTAGSLHYQSAASVTALLSLGTAGQVLAVNSSGTTIAWTSSTSLLSGNANYATTAGTADLAINVKGGGAGRVLWQTAIDSTGFTSAGTAGQIFVSGGTGAPTFSAVGSISATGGTGGTGILSIAGDINATKEITAYYSSDARLKENVTVIENALLKVRSLSGVMFDWKDDVIADKGGEDGYFVRKHDTGIIAQDVEKVLPEVVATRDDGFLAVRYEKLAGLIIQAINELANEVDELKKRIQ